MAENPYAKYANPYAGLVPVGTPDPNKPLETQGKQLSNTRTQQEIDLANATAAAQAAKARAEALKAEIDAKNAKEQYDAQHRPVSTTGTYGADYLKTLSPSDQATVRALDEGRLAFPMNAGMRSPFWQEKLSQVAQYDPNFDATNFNARAKGRAAAISGKLGQSNNALNTAIGHLDTLNGQISGTASHGGFPLATTVNALENWYSKGSGDPGVTNFQDTAAKLADELESAYRNGGGAEAGVIRQLRSLDPNMSADQKNGIIHNAMDLLASKMQANLSQYNFGTGGKPDWTMLDPHVQQVLSNPQFQDIRDKYFAVPANIHGGGNSGPPTLGGGTPPGSPPNGPDFSGLTGGNAQSLVTADPTHGALRQTYQNVFDPAAAGTLSAFIKRGEPYATVVSYAQSHGFNPPDPDTYKAAVAFAAQHGGATNVEATRSIPTTFGERMSSSPVVAALSGGLSGATAGLSDVAGRAAFGLEYDANRAALAANSPSADLLGNIAGGTAGMLAGGSLLGDALRAGAKGGIARNIMALGVRNPAKAGALGDAAYGSVYGATQNPDDPLAGATLGGITGLGGGAAGNALAKGTGAVLQGVTNPAVQRLRSAGIPLTVGETLGGGFKKAQDALTSVFGPGNMVARRYNDGREALQQAAFSQGGAPIGANISAIGQAGINALDQAKSAAYARALNPINLDLNTPQAVGDIGNALKSAINIPNVDQARDLATGAMSNYIGNAAPNGNMSGTDFQQAYRGLSRTANNASQRIYGHEIGQSLGQARQGLVNALQAQNPGAYEGFLNANAANRNLNILSDAVNAAKNQIGDNGEPMFTPAQLGTAATANAKKYGSNISAAAGNRPFNQLINDSQQVMSSKLPESGTFPRALLAGAVMAPGGMFGAHQDGVSGAAGGAAIPLSLLTLMGTKKGQQLLTAALLNRTAQDRIAGQFLTRNPQVGGDVLTAAGIPLLTGP